MERIFKVAVESNKAVKYNDRLSKILAREMAEDEELGEDDMMMVAGGIKIPEWNPEE